MIAWLKRQNAWYWSDRKKAPIWIVGLFPFAIAAAFMHIGYEYLDRDSASICSYIVTLWLIIFWAWTLRQWWRDRP